MKYIRKLLLAIFLIPPLLSQAAEVLYIGFDAGETNIFAEILKDSSEQAPILALGTAAKVAKEQGLSSIIEAPCPSQNRFYEFSDKELAEIKEKCGAPEIVVTGLFSTPQKQLSQLFKKEGSLIIGYWDNFSSVDKMPADLVANMDEFAALADYLISPSREVADDLNARFDIHSAVALGQPTLEAWEKKVQQIDAAKGFEKTGLSREKPLLVYVGGYGADYDEAFALFAASLKEMGGQVDLLIQLHPKVDGAFEKKFLEWFAATHPGFPPYYISGSGDLSIYEAAAMASLILTQKSTVGIQALFAGKKSLYIDVPGTHYTNFAIEKNLAKQVYAPSEAAQAIEEALQASPASAEECYEKSGIPRHAVDNFTRFLFEAKRHH